MNHRRAHWISERDLLLRAVQVDAWAWRHWHLDHLEGSTRTPALHPGAARRFAMISGASVEQVARRRAMLLRAEVVERDEPTTGGRMLAFDPDSSLSDGAAAAESAGFCDEDNIPPWDCWLAFIAETPRSPDRWNGFDSYLLCWIPAPLVALVQRAVDVNPEQCLCWADQLATPFLEQLRRSGGPWTAPLAQPPASGSR